MNGVLFLLLPLFWCEFVVCVCVFSGSRSLTAKHIACRFSTTYLHRDEKSC